MSLTRQAVSGVKWNSGAMAVRIGMQFLTLAVLARYLSPEDFGLMSMAVVFIGFAQAFTDFGLSNAIIHRQDVTRGQLSSLYWLNLAMGFAIFGGLWLAIPLIVAYYREPALTEVLRWSALSFLIVPIGQQFQSLLRRELHFRLLSIIQTIDSLVYATTAIGLAFAGFGVMSLVWGALLQAFVDTSILTGIAIRWGWLPTMHFRRSDLRGFVGFGLFQMGERSLNYLATNVDYLIIGKYLGADALGYYTLAYNLTRLPQTYLNPVIVSVAFPTFARIRDDDEVIRRGYIKLLSYLALVSFPTMGGLFVTAPLLIPILYGEQWMPSVPLVQIFAIVGVWKSLGNPLGSLLLAKGRADLGFYMNLFAIVGYTISNLIGVQWGVTGVALSTLIFQTFVLMPIDHYLRWLLIRMSVRQYWQATRYPFFAAVIMMVGVTMLREMWEWGFPVLELATLASVGGGLYLSIIYLFNSSILFEVIGYLRPAASK